MTDIGVFVRSSLSLGGCIDSPDERISFKPYVHIQFIYITYFKGRMLM